MEKNADGGGLPSQQQQLQVEPQAAQPPALPVAQAEVEKAPNPASRDDNWNTAITNPNIQGGW